MAIASFALVGLGGGAFTVHLARRYFDESKAIFDFLVAIIALLVALPVLAVCAAIIKLSSPGPVFFTQVRLGKDGRPFRMIKMRTMHVAAEAGTGAVWAQDGDPRIITACRWMRRSHVDELPQLLHVLRGQMSLVGPRPERPEITAELERTYPRIRGRLAVRPGITGLAQVTCGYDTTVEAFRHKLAADLEYVANRNWVMELRVLGATVAKFNDSAAR